MSEFKPYFEYFPKDNRAGSPERLSLVTPSKDAASREIRVLQSMAHFYYKSGERTHRLSPDAAREALQTLISSIWKDETCLPVDITAPVIEYVNLGTVVDAETRLTMEYFPGSGYAISSYDINALPVLNFFAEQLIDEHKFNTAAHTFQPGSTYSHISLGYANSGGNYVPFVTMLSHTHPARQPFLKLASRS